MKGMRSRVASSRRVSSFFRLPYVVLRNDNNLRNGGIGVGMEMQIAEKEANSYRWVILSLTVFCFVLTFLIRFSWPPLIPVVGPLLKMTMTQAGAYMSAFYIGYVITQVPAGILSDRFGVRLILAASLVIEGISTWAMGMVTGFEMGFWLRIASGLGAGAVYSACARGLDGMVCASGTRDGLRHHVGCTLRGHGTRQLPGTCIEHLHRGGKEHLKVLGSPLLLSASYFTSSSRPMIPLRAHNPSSVDSKSYFPVEICSSRPLPASVCFGLNLESLHGPLPTSRNSDLIWSMQGWY